MRKLFFIISLSLFGCMQQNKIETLTPNNYNFGAKDQKSELPNGDNIKSANGQKTNNTRILYYYVDPITLSQNASDVSGTFYWQDECLYLLSFDENKKIIKKTVMFPEYPKHEVSWNEEKKTLTLIDRGEPPKTFEFQMGDYIRTNGRSVSKIPDNISLKNQEEYECLSKDGISFIGTIDIEKISNAE